MKDPLVSLMVIFCVFGIMACGVLLVMGWSPSGH